MSDENMKMPKFSEIEYVRPSVEQFRECAMSTRLKLMAARDPEAAETAIMAFQREMSAFDTAFTICMIRHDLDTADPFWNEEMDFFDDVVIEQQTAEEHKTDEVPVVESEPAKAEQEGTVIDFDEPEEAASVMTMKKQPTGEPGIGYLKPGADLNIVFKKLAGHSDATADTIDTNIHQVKIRVPSKHITDTVEGTPVTISDGSSSAEVVAYYQDNTLWLYSEETDIIQFNEHCNGMFAGLEGLENVYLFDDAADTSRITDAEDMFAGDVSIAEVDLSSFNASNLNTVQRMFEDCDAIATLRLGSNWKFTGSASLPDKNWKSSKDGSVWTTAALETKFTGNDAATFTATGDSATVDTDILYVGSGLKSGNMQEVHTKVPFTGYCINDTNHDRRNH